MTDDMLRRRAAHLAITAIWAPWAFPMALAYWALVAGRG
jgi:hypothetical protein